MVSSVCPTATAPSTKPTPPPTPLYSSQSSNGLCFATWNVHSLHNKYVSVSNTIISCGIDVFVATESWHQSSSDVAVRRSTPPGYSAVDRSQPDGSSYGRI